MSTPRTYPAGFYHEEFNLTKVVGTWDIVGGAGAVNTVIGHGFAVARTAAGTYTITFTDAFSYLLSAHASMQTISGAGVDQYCQLGAFTPGAAGAATLVIRTKTIAANVDPAATDSVHFEATMYGETLD